MGKNLHYEKTARVEWQCVRDYLYVRLSQIFIWHANFNFCLENRNQQLVCFFRPRTLEVEKDLDIAQGLRRICLVTIVFLAMAQNGLRFKHVCYLFVRENRCDVSVQALTSVIEPMLLIDGILPVAVHNLETHPADLGLLLDWRGFNFCFLERYILEVIFNVKIHVIENDLVILFWGLRKWVEVFLNFFVLFINFKCGLKFSHKWFSLIFDLYIRG